MDGVVAYILSRNYTKNTVIGMGAIKGAPCQVQSINKVGKTTTITLKWEDNVGGVHTQAFDVEDGADGVSVSTATIDANGHLILTLSNGNNIDCGQVLPQYDTMPPATSTNEGQILQYIGTTTVNYKNGYFYICESDGSGGFHWVEKLVQDSYTKAQIGSLDDLPDTSKNVIENIVDINNKLDDKEDRFRFKYNTIPLASASIEGVIIEYIGVTNADYTNGYFYQCIENPNSAGNYIWVQKNVQPSGGGTGGDGVVDGYYYNQQFYEDSAHLNPITGESDTIYVDLDSNSLYRYNGSIFIQVSSASNIQVNELPTADASQENKIYQYIGATTSDYTNGYFYKCKNDGGTYKWEGIATQDSYTKAEIGSLSSLPYANKNVVENIDLLHGSMIGLQGSISTLQGSVVDIKNNINVLDGSVVNIKNDITNLQGSLAAIDKDKLDKLKPIYLIGSGLVLDDSDPTSPNYGKLTATGMSIPIDDHLSASSPNPVQNQVITRKINQLDGSKLSLDDVDDALSGSSVYPVQNQVVTLAIDQLQGSVLKKIQKMIGAQEDNFAIIDNDGGVKDSGISKDVVPASASVSNKLLVASDLSVKADKVSGATNDDIALLDGTGNLKDSTKKLSDLQDKLAEGDGIDIDANNKISLKVDYLTASRVGYIPATEKGSNGGVAELDNAGKVPSGQLPSYVDDVIEGYLYNGAFYTDSAHTDPITPESGKIYVDLHTNTTYRWGGTAYVQISESLALGTTHTTAYYGDYGQTAYNHSQITNGTNPHNTTADNVNLKVPIPALSGTKLDVESTFYGINTTLGTKADKVTSATSGNFAGLDGNGNLTDSGKKANDFYKVVTFDKNTDIDANSIQDDGIYKFPNDYAGTATNFPTIWAIAGGAVLRVLNLAPEGYCEQMFIPYGSSANLYFRACHYLNGIKWTDWQIMAYKNEVIAKADLTDLAPTFSSASAYAIGAYVTYNGDLYRFTSAHTAGDPWSSSEVTQVTVGSELGSISSTDILPPSSPTPTESTVVSAISGAPANTTSAASAYAVQQWSNTDRKRLIYEITANPSGTTGIGTWDSSATPVETDWWQNDAFKLPDSANSKNIDIEFRYDPQYNSGEVVPIGGYILDTTTGKLCIKFAKKLYNAQLIAVDINYTRNNYPT